MRAQYGSREGGIFQSGNVEAWKLLETCGHFRLTIFFFVFASNTPSPQPFFHFSLFPPLNPPSTTLASLASKQIALLLHLDQIKHSLHRHYHHNQTVLWPCTTRGRRPGRAEVRERCDRPHPQQTRPSSAQLSGTAREGEYKEDRSHGDCGKYYLTW